MTKLKPNSVILDLGAGTGRQSLIIAKKDLNVIAVDFAVRMLDQLRDDAANSDLGSRISVVVADVMAQPFRGQIFDGIEMVSALHHIPSLELRIAGVREVYRVTRTAGQVVVTVWLRRQRRFYRPLVSSALKVAMRKAEWGDVFVPWNKRPRFYHLFGEAELKSLFLTSGFRIETIEVRTFGRDDSRGDNRNVFLVASKT